MFVVSGVGVFVVCGVNGVVASVVLGNVVSVVDSRVVLNDGVVDCADGGVACGGPCVCFCCSCCCYTNFRTILLCNR